MIYLHSHTWLRKIFVAFIALVIILTYIPQEAFAANGWRPGSKAYFRNGSDLIGSDGKKFYNDHRKYTNRWYTDSGLQIDKNCYAQQGPRHAYTIKPTGGGSAIQGYCLEQDVANPTSGNTKYVAEEWVKSKWIQKYSENTQRGIRLTLLYGKQPDSKTSDIEKLFGVSGANLADWYVATQQIIWEFQQGLRPNIASIPKNVSATNLGTQSYRNTPKDFFYSPIKGRKAGQVYIGILKAMQKHKLIPSFTGISAKKAKTISMEETSSGIWKSVNPKYTSLKTDAEKEAARQNADYYTITDRNDGLQGLKVMNLENYFHKQEELER